MKHLLIILALLIPSLANAQSSGRNPCYNSGGSNCIPVGTSNPLPTAIFNGGNTAAVSIDGALAVNTPPNTEFSDQFSGALDTTTNWTTNNSSGTTATSAGSLVVSGTTTASQWGGLSTKQSWTSAGASSQIFGAAAVFNTIAIPNTVRIFGVYTSPASPTLAAPITDGYVFRLDATGTLFAEVWASGVPVFSQNLSNNPACAPIAGVPFNYYFNYRPSLIQFGCNNVATAAVAFVNPVNQTLPISAYSIAGLSNPSSAATMSLTAIILSSYTPPNLKSVNQSPTINDLSGVVATSPVTPSSTAALAANQTILSSAGDLYSFEVSADSTLSAAPWFIMIFDATAAPADGAVTPKKCFAQPSGATLFSTSFPAPLAFNTGITISSSTTGCFTKTASTHAFISGDAK